MWIGKSCDSDSECVISDPNYEDKINRIETPHERVSRAIDALTEDEQAILRPELGKLMRLAQIARPGAIYDASDAAQTFTDWEIVDFQIGIGAISNTAESENTKKEAIPNKCMVTWISLGKIDRMRIR